MLLRSRLSLKRAGNQSGFTLLELLMALLIISILSMISIPMYLNYSIRTKISAGISMIGPAKNGISEYYWGNNQYPISNGQAGIAEGDEYNSNYLLRLDVLSDPAGAIMLTFDNAQIPALGSNNIIMYKVTKVDGSLKWDCRFGNMKDQYRPKNCQVE